MFAKRPGSPVREAHYSSSLLADNAVMVGWASMDRFLKKDHDPFDIDLKPTWSLEDLSSEDMSPSETNMP